MDPLSFKESLRAEARSLRENISASRRLEAELSASEIELAGQSILSYSAISSELSLSKLNKRLAEEGRLVLPAVESHTLRFYLVKDTGRELIKSSFGILEPNPDLCREIFSFDDSTLLIPGLYFDLENTRLGYGRGHFDKILHTVRSNAELIGVGFKEQLYSGTLPREEHDISLDRLLLF